MKKVKQSISVRAATYLVLFAVLITSTLFFIPEVLSIALSLYVPKAPIEALIFAPHPVICEEAKSKIANLKPVEKIKLAKTITQTLKQGPIAIKENMEKNKLLNMFSDLLSNDTSMGIVKHLAAEQCIFEVLKILGSAANEAIPFLIQESTIKAFENSGPAIQEILIENLKTNPKALKGLVDSFLKNRDEQNNVLSSRLLINFLQSNNINTKIVLDMFDSIDLQSKKTGIIQHILFSPVPQQTTLPNEIGEYLVDSKKDVHRRLLLLQWVRNMGHLQKLDTNVLTKLSNDSEPLIQNEVRLTFQNSPIRTQEELNVFVNMHKDLFQNFELKTQEDWVQIDKLVSFYQSLNQKIPRFMGSENDVRQTTFDFSTIRTPTIEILKKISSLLGFQTQTYKKLIEAVINSPVAKEFAPYFEQLLEQKNERLMALQFLIRVDGFNKVTQTKMAKFLINEDEKNINDILRFLQQIPYINVRAMQRKMPLFDSLLNDALLKIASGKNDQLSKLAFQVLYVQGEPLVIYVREELKTAQGALKLVLLRLNWRLSSTDQALKSLLAELRSSKNCDFQFANSFSDFVTKSPDSPSGKGSGLIQGASSMSYREVLPTELISPVFSVQQSPGKDLFLKFLTCDLKYIQKATIYSLCQFDKSFVEIIKAPGNRFSEEKKKYLLDALTMPKNRYPYNEDI